MLVATLIRYLVKNMQKAWFKTRRSGTEIGRDYRLLCLIGV